MRVIERAAEMHEVRATLVGPVAMMATLGGIHAGHEALLRRARAEGASVVASLFLNPTQFNDPEDLAHYPVDRARDLAIFEQHGVDITFAPTVSEMYPEDAMTTVDPGPIGTVLEGAGRPGHFQGVATVVTKLLTVIRPDIAVWGAKDAQQNVVIRRITTDLRMAVSHLIEPTVRAPDGLALSSRNTRLSPDQRRQAASLYGALGQALACWRASVRDAEEIREAVREALVPFDEVTLEYVSLADPDTLTELRLARPGAILSLAAWVGPVRLIDNVTLE